MLMVHSPPSWSYLVPSHQRFCTLLPASKSFLHFSSTQRRQLRWVVKRREDDSERSAAGYLIIFWAKMGLQNSQVSVNRFFTLVWHRAKCRFQKDADKVRDPDSANKNDDILQRRMAREAVIRKVCKFIILKHCTVCVCAFAGKLVWELCVFGYHRHLCAS